ncbi:MAG: DUF1598 domain-containing protein [Pirellulaceae bacterium]
MPRVTMWGSAIAQLLLLLCGLCGTASAQNGNYFRNQVGGVSIDTNGLLKNAEVKDVHALRAEMLRELAAVPDDLNRFSELRKVSLRKLQEAIGKSLATGKPLPDDVKYLAGLQQIRYIFVYPDQRDVVLVGPAEGWQVNDDGFVVGRTTGRPVILLDDLLVAIRTATAAARQGISCSIDPTKDGLARLQGLVRRLSTIGDPARTIHNLEVALGRQTITVTGVPDTSNFGRVLVAADFQMKRLAMGFDKAPVPDLPSFLQMTSASGRGLQNMLPRWWLAPNYQKLARDEEGLSWEIRGAAVKCMTESDFLNADGTRKQGVSSDKTAQRWADQFTAKYEAISAKNVIFAQLRNLMDLSIVGALLIKEHLIEKAELDVGLLMNSRELLIGNFVAPKGVDSSATFLRKGRNWIISLSGGVQLNSWQVADQNEVTSALVPLREKMATTVDSWWWD